MALKVSCRKKIPEIYIGKKGADWAHFYARFAKKPEIYLASGMNRSLAAQTPRYYRERRIVNVSENGIKGLTISGSGKTYSVEKSSTGWKFSGKEPAGFRSVEASCRQLTAMGFSAVKDFKGNIKIEIEKNDGSSVSWEMGKKEANVYTAKRDGRPDVYKIPTATAEKIIKFLGTNSAK